MNKQELVKRINDLLIIRQGDNYHLFGQYVITRVNDLYNVSCLSDLDMQNLQFAQLKHAVTWCVFHKNKKHKDLAKITELDEILGGLQVTISNLKRLSEKADNELKYIYLAKLSEDKIKRHYALKAMSFFIDTSKYWQSKTFKENQTL